MPEPHDRFYTTSRDFTNDDLLFRHRLRLFALAGEVGVSCACRELNYHRSSYYRWKARVEREALEILRPRAAANADAQPDLTLA